MERLERFIRGCGWTIGGLLALSGLYFFIHDALIFVHLVAPYGDGPYGVVAGPIFMVIGIVLMVWLRSTKPIKYED